MLLHSIECVVHVIFKLFIMSKTWSFQEYHLSKPIKESPELC